jgi:hypothetical protein
LREAYFVVFEDFRKGIQQLFDVVAVAHAIGALRPVIFQTQPHQKNKLVFFKTREPKRLLIQNNQTVSRS